MMCTPSEVIKNTESDAENPDKPLTHAGWLEKTQPNFNWKFDLLCDRMQSAENAGLIIRTALGLGIQNIYFLSSIFKWNAKRLKKLSRSANQYVNIQSIESLSEIDLSTYSNIVSLEYSQKSKSIYSNRLEGSTLLILGSEYDGIQDYLLNLSHEVYHIPLVGEQSSINVAQAFSGAMVYFNANRIQK